MYVRGAHMADELVNYYQLFNIDEYDDLETVQDQLEALKKQYGEAVWEQDEDDPHAEQMYTQILEAAEVFATDEAREAYDDKLFDDSTPEGREDKAYRKYYHGFLDEAFQITMERLAEDPDDADAMQLLEALASYGGRYEEAYREWVGPAEPDPEPEPEPQAPPRSAPWSSPEKEDLLGISFTSSGQQSRPDGDASVATTCVVEAQNAVRRQDYEAALHHCCDGLSQPNVPSDTAATLRVTMRKAILPNGPVGTKALQKHLILEAERIESAVRLIDHYNLDQQTRATVRDPLLHLAAVDRRVVDRRHQYETKGSLVDFSADSFLGWVGRMILIVILLMAFEALLRALIPPLASFFGAISWIFFIIGAFITRPNARSYHLGFGNRLREKAMNEAYAERSTVVSGILGNHG